MRPCPEIIQDPIQSSQKVKFKSNQITKNPKSTVNGYGCRTKVSGTPRPDRNRSGKQTNDQAYQGLGVGENGVEKTENIIFYLIFDLILHCHCRSREKFQRQSRSDLLEEACHEEETKDRIRVREKKKYEWTGMRSGSIGNARLSSRSQSMMREKQSIYQKRSKSSKSDMKNRESSTRVDEGNDRWHWGRTCSHHSHLSLSLSLSISRVIQVLQAGVGSESPSGRKRSKSLGNFPLVDQVLVESLSKRAFGYNSLELIFLIGINVK